MAYYEYKRVRDHLIKASLVDAYGLPADKKKYGNNLDTDYDGNMWTITADYIENLEEQNAALVKELEAVKAENGRLNMEKVHYEGLLCGGESINKIKADALFGFVSAVNGAVENDFITDKEAEEMDLNDFILLAEKHANSLINKEG